MQIRIAAGGGLGGGPDARVPRAGAALGVAILGAVLAGSYTGHMPDTVAEHAREAISDALAVARATGDGALAAAARSAFTVAMSTTFVAGACAVLGAAAPALVLMRERAGRAENSEQEEKITPEPVGVDR